METYLRAFGEALSKEFRTWPPTNPYNLTDWRQLFYDYSLSEESFKNDIEEPLRLSVEEIPSKAWKERVKKSQANKFVEEHGVVFR